MTGPNTMLGYYKKTEATSEIIIRHKDGLNWRNYVTVHALTGREL